MLLPIAATGHWLSASASLQCTAKAKTCSQLKQEEEVLLQTEPTLRLRQGLNQALLTMTLMTWIESSKLAAGRVQPK